MLARKRLAKEETGEVRGHSYRILAGSEVHEVTQWGHGEPAFVGASVELFVGVRAFARRSGGAGWNLTMLETSD